MKSIVMPKNEELTDNKTKASAKDETSTTAVNANKKTKFTAIDMWNRQRKSRSASDMMRRWNLN
ncbi:MAG TPA: hypothetical protein VMZ03_00440 [Chitinophagaceae bacterium]|nr:hypothetical protein [Chitinophagaceae bacterium]